MEVNITPSQRRFLEWYDSWFPYSTVVKTTLKYNKVYTQYDRVVLNDIRAFYLTQYKKYLNDIRN